MVDCNYVVLLRAPGPWRWRADHEVALFTRPFPALSRSGNPTGGGRSILAGASAREPGPSTARRDRISKFSICFQYVLSYPEP